MEDFSNYDNLKEAAQKLYNSTNKVFSPALNEEVFFNSEGFNHIIYKNPRNEREVSSKIIRFKLLPLAINLLKKSTTYQEVEETIKEFEVKSYKKRVRQTKVVKYWGIIAIINNRKIKVIVRRIGENGNVHFWSVIPDWVTNKYRDTKFISMMKGSPEED